MRPNRSPQGPEQAVVLALSITAAFNAPGLTLACGVRPDRSKAVRTALWTRGLPMAVYVEKRGE
jgi:hypothetical protein